jgi:monofunctional biosynthetic peptidoglycan transglycosylase
MLPYRRRANRSSRKGTDSLAERLSSILIYTLFFLIFTPIVLAIIYRYAPPPVTPLMLIRLAEGQPIHKTWKPLNQISPALRQSVIGAEDNLFCQHNGFDWKSINKAFDQWQARMDGEAPEGKPLKGGSTISQQTAKNIFLIPNRSILRKAVEAPLTVLIEHLWPKQRILEVYLNVAEWGPGIYGAEAAARYHFHTSARNLTRQQAAQLAAILPLPLHWSASRPGPYVASRSRAIIRRTYQLGPTYLGCTVPLKKA